MLGGWMHLRLTRWCLTQSCWTVRVQRRRRNSAAAEEETLNARTPPPASSSSPPRPPQWWRTCQRRSAPRPPRARAPSTSPTGEGAAGTQAGFPKMGQRVSGTDRAGGWAGALGAALRVGLQLLHQPINCHPHQPSPNPNPNPNPTQRTERFLRACSSGDTVEVRSMLDRDCPPDSADYDVRTGLMLATAKGHREVGGFGGWEGGGWVVGGGDRVLLSAAVLPLRSTLW